MRIALLNLQYDTNYGGNLQRYALMTVLQRMGHDVTHLNLRFNFNPVPLSRRLLRLCKRLVYKSFGKLNTDILHEYNCQKRYEQSCKATDSFYNRYIKHTPILNQKNQLAKQMGYDAYIVGSDQVWRKSIAGFYGIETYFFDFLSEDNKAKRIAYGVSLGTSESELNDDDFSVLTPLYKRLFAVSVREDSSLKLLTQYGWNNPIPSLVLDPTLLLKKEDYLKLINDGSTRPSEGNMFCYILDPTEEKSAIIKEYEKKNGLKAFVESDKGDKKMPIQQWLRSFYESEFVVTDSFHGMVFCIIFNKPFKIIFNLFRGNARFESLMRVLQIPEDTETIDWVLTNKLINEQREQSINFLKQALQ